MPPVNSMSKFTLAAVAGASAAVGAATSALNALGKVSAVGTTSHLVRSLIMFPKICEEQKFCRDEAIELVEQFKSFASIEPRILVLNRRTETRKAIEAMLVLMGSTADYICNNSKSRNMIGRSDEL